MADASTVNPLLDLWRKQFEESAAAWTRMVGQAPLTPDLASQWKQFMDQWIEAWSKALGQAMNTDAYAQMIGKFLDQWLVASAPMKKAAEQQIDQALQTLNMASRSQLTAVAKQIVELEERLERMEDTLGAILQRLDHKEPK